VIFYVQQILHGIAAKRMGRHELTLEEVRRMIGDGMRALMDALWLCTGAGRELDAGHLAR